MIMSGLTRPTSGDIGGGDSNDFERANIATLARLGG
jgi:hypothetical protein